MGKYISGISCPHCGYEFDRAVGEDGTGTPEAGNLSICVRCAGVAIFTEAEDGSLGQRPLTQDEWDDIPYEDLQAIHEMTANVRQALRRALQLEKENKK